MAPTVTIISPRTIQVPVKSWDPAAVVEENEHWLHGSGLIESPGSECSYQSDFEEIEAVCATPKKMLRTLVCPKAPCKLALRRSKLRKRESFTTVGVFFKSAEVEEFLLEQENRAGK